MSYLPYFTCSTTTPSATSTNSSIAPQAQRKDKCHPSETFHFLSAVTNHILSQPPLTISQLSVALLPRLAEEWKAWVDRIDETVKHGGMFGLDMVSSWERGLDELADSKVAEVANMMRAVRDGWVHRVGWLVGRTSHHAMDV